MVRTSCGRVSSTLEEGKGEVVSARLSDLPYCRGMVARVCWGSVMDSLVQVDFSTSGFNARLFAFGELLDVAVHRVLGDVEVSISAYACAVAVRKSGTGKGKASSSTR